MSRTDNYRSNSLARSSRPHYDREVRRTGERRLPRVLKECQQDLSTLYTYKDWLCDAVRESMIKRKLYVPFLPKLIVEYVPLYEWTMPCKSENEKENDFMRVKLSHCNTVASNEHAKFGAVLGTKLDPRCDHVINVRLEEGIEFGIGLCDEAQAAKQPTKRDFMCCKGGFGYYNYKTKSLRMRPKFPPGHYCETNICHTKRDEEQIMQTGDTMTMVIQRQDASSGKEVAPGGGYQSPARTYERPLSIDSPSPRSMRRVRRPIKKTSKGRDGLVSLSYYLNGKPMANFHLVNLKGPFFLCMNYYFVDSTVRLVTDYNFQHEHARFLRRKLASGSRPASVLSSQRRSRQTVRDEELSIE